jgi:hypothetical protein
VLSRAGTRSSGAPSASGQQQQQQQPSELAVLQPLEAFFARPSLSAPALLQVGGCAVSLLRKVVVSMCN